jgi:hypothetical protein
MSCLLGGGEEKEASAWAERGHSAQVSPSLHSAFRTATCSPFVAAVEPPSTSVGDPTSSRLTADGCCHTRFLSQNRMLIV